MVKAKPAPIQPTPTRQQHNAYLENISIYLLSASRVYYIPALLEYYPSMY